MTHREPIPFNEVTHVTTEHLGKVKDGLGTRSVFLYRHFRDEEEVYSIESSIPAGPSVVTMAAQER